MKNKIPTILTILLYCVLVLVTAGVGLLGFLYFMWNDILRYYGDGILKPVYGLIAVLGIILPIVIFTKNKKRWILPVVLSISIVCSLSVCIGINECVKYSLSSFSVENWGKYKYLRLYMLDDLQNRFTFEGATEESVLELLGEPTFVRKVGGKKSMEYYVGSDFIDVIVFYIDFEDGIVVKTGKYQS